MVLLLKYLLLQVSYTISLVRIYFQFSIPRSYTYPKSVEQFLRLRHLPVQPYKATITTKYGRAGESMLLVEYKDIQRSLALFFTTEFPHTIERWEETYRSGFGPAAEVMTTTGVLNKRIKAPYWNLNSNTDAHSS